MCIDGEGTHACGRISCNVIHRSKSWVGRFIDPEGSGRLCSGGTFSSDCP